MRWLFGVAALVFTALVFWGATALMGLIFSPKTAKTAGGSIWQLLVPAGIGLVVLAAVRLRTARERRRRMQQHDHDA